MTRAGATRRAFLGELARLGGSLAGLGVLAACAPATAPTAAGQPRVYRVGLLLGSGSKPLFWRRLTELGYVAGQNLAREERRSDAGSFTDVAEELVRLPVDMIAASLDPGIDAAVKATASIPIVMMGSPLDPVASGWVESLARPGRNVTGLAGPPPDVELKRLQLLVEAAPQVTKVAVLTGDPQLPDEPWRAAAGALGGDLLILSIPGSDWGPTIERAVANGADALLIRAGFGAGPNRGVIVDVAARHRLPTMFFERMFVTAGALMAYVPRGSEIDRRAADFVDRILRGERPADLPVELPRSYDLVVNARTAKALGLTLPPAFLARVDEMIE